MSSSPVTDSAPLFDVLLAWFDEQEAELRSRDIKANLDTSLTDFEKGSITLAMESGARLGQVTLWATGESVIEVAEASTGRIRHENRDVHSGSELLTALAELQHTLGVESRAA